MRPSEDPRIRKMTVSPRNNDSNSFKAMAKALAETDEFFKQSGEIDEALWKATDAAEKVYLDDMDAEMWRTSDEAEHNSKERHPSPSLLLSCSPPLLHPHPHPHHHTHTYTSHHHAHTYTSQVCARDANMLSRWNLPLRVSPSVDREALRKAALTKIEREITLAEKEYSDKEEAIKYSKKYSAKEQVVDLTMEQE